MKKAVASTRARKNEPAYKRIQTAIRERIDSGELRPGDVVFSERELAKIHGVSLMTARHALASLAHEGVVERRHGAGTFVAPPQIHFNKLLSYAEQTASLGLVPRSKIVFSGIVNREEEIAAKLGLSSTAKLIKVERIRDLQNSHRSREEQILRVDLLFDVEAVPEFSVEVLRWWLPRCDFKRRFGETL